MKFRTCPLYMYLDMGKAHPEERVAVAESRVHLKKVGQVYTLTIIMGQYLY